MAATASEVKLLELKVKFKHKGPIKISIKSLPTRVRRAVRKMLFGMTPT